MKKDWRRESVVYQIYPRSFCDTNGDGIGDLNGITSKLDYLKELGADVLWLCPIYKSPNRDNGYDVSDYTDVMDEFGTMEDFDRLLTEAHSRGLKIILDLVVNHTSSEHPWFIESKKGKDSPLRDYYIWRNGKNGGPPNNWESFFSGPAWDFDEASGQYYLHLFAPGQPDLNWENEEVRLKVYEMMRWWFDKGIDGFRMDTVNMYSKTPGLPDGKPIPGTAYGDKTPHMINGPRIHEFLREMNREVLSKYDVMSVGETPCTTVEEAVKYASLDRSELDMIFQFEHMDTDYVDGQKWCDPKLDFIRLKQVLSHWQTGLDGRGWNSLYWNNHDQPRAVSRFGDDTEYWLESAKMLGICLHMMQGTPFIYQGEEIGMTNVEFESLDDYDDVEIKGAYAEYTKNRGVSHENMMRYIARMGRDNARTPMQWDSGENAGFTTGKPWLKVNPNYREINVASQLNDDNSILNCYNKLILLRKSYPIIVYGGYEPLYPEDPSIFAYIRRLGGDTLLVVCSFSKEEAGFAFPADLPPDKAQLLISNYADPAEGDMLLRPYEARAYLFKA